MELQKKINKKVKEIEDYVEEKLNVNPDNLDISIIFSHNTWDCEIEIYDDENYGESHWCFEGDSLSELFEDIKKDI